VTGDSSGKSTIAPATKALRQTPLGARTPRFRSWLQCKIDPKNLLHIGQLEGMRRNEVKLGEKTMSAHEPIRHEPARGRLAPDEWARIDPIVYLTEARRLQARATAEAIAAGWRGIRRGLASAARLLRRFLLDRAIRRAERRRALAALAGMDDRLLADIGLRRGDIELAVDGRLADPRVTPRTRPVPSAERAPAPQQPGQIFDAAA
jgi:uncharacterized protein YjiS (DUF1127 family)